MKFQRIDLPVEKKPKIHVLMPTSPKSISRGNISMQVVFGSCDLEHPVAVGIEGANGTIFRIQPG